MKLSIHSLILLVLHATVHYSNGTDDSKYVRISLDSHWKNTPILLEASEFIAAESQDSFWKFVEGTLDVFKKETDRDVYSHIIDVASQILSTLEVDLLKLALSSRAFSPKLELFRQIGRDLNLPDCEVVFFFKDNFYCDIEELLNKLAKSNSVHLKFGYSFDHIYPQSENNPLTVICYGQLGTKSFKMAHQTLADLSGQRRVKYILRHYIKDNGNEKVRLSGYGVELAIKSTEYKAVDDQKVDEKEHASHLDHSHHEDEVDGFLFRTLSDRFPDLKSQLEQFRKHLKESNKELAPLKVWQLQDLSLQAAQRVMSSSPSEALRVLRDVSQNLPMLARSLVRTTVKDEMKEEIKRNQQEFEKFDIGPGDTSVFINGLQLQLESLDPYMLGKLLKEEATTMNRLEDLGLQGDAANDIITMNVKSSDEKYVIDIRSPNVQWMNDLEKDSQYSYWPSNFEEILRPTFPGMLRYIAKNIFHVVICIDPVDPESIQLFQTAKEYVGNSMPARFGVLFVANGNKEDDGRKHVGVGIVRAFSFIQSDKDTSQAFEFLAQLYHSARGRFPSASDLESKFKKMYGQDELLDTLGPNSEYDDLRENSETFYHKTGLRDIPKALVNGLPLTYDEMLHIENSIIEKMLMQTQEIQNAVYLGRLQSHSSVYDYVLSQSHVVKRLNSLIQRGDSEYISISKGKIDTWSEDIEKFKTLEPRQMLSALSQNVKYFHGDKGAVTIWVIADATTPSGRELIMSAMKHVTLKPSSSSKRKQQGKTNTRVALILHKNEKGQGDPELSINHILQSLLSLREKLISGVAKLIAKIVEEAEQLDNSSSKIHRIVELAQGITGINKKKLEEVLSSKEEIAAASTVFEVHSIIVQKGLNLPSCKAAVICNGRLLGPLTVNDVFNEDDFRLLQNYEEEKSAAKIDELVEKMDVSDRPPDGRERYKSDLVMRITSILSQREQRSRQKIAPLGDKRSVVHLPPQRPGISYDIVTILDPLTPETQKLVPMLMALYNVTNVRLKIFMNCKEKLSEMPLKRFYRYVLEPQLVFDSNGKLMNTQQALFMGMPQSAILTLNMDTPQSWMVEAVRSPFDLDNIHLAQVEQGVFGDFELEYILLEGHCADAITGSPPRGLQFTLGTSNNPERFDTIVMANLGYFQLKGSPGNFILQLRKGRSSDIYTIESVTGGDKDTYEGNFSITVDGFSGKFLKVKVRRRPGKEHDDLLSDGQDSPSQGIWDSFTSYVSGDRSDGRGGDTIHIFSVATGLLYERMLRIMMLSVMKTTKSRVKFWFLKNYLSPTFTSFLPHMAKEYKFEYELVQYQWPRWLNHQKDKQRIIWGYKILFLDVLFPLNIGRVIFVDADQVVRADLKELMEMDLEGAPYAYTPFCSDRKEMDGFRFWNQGYWKSHLGGRPYHISALYVVDLKTFRRIAAGDRLRGQYQGLSQDPNSLANLDQDLPNNMIHQVPIKSLPQEWLWCETWCSDYSKTYAKTIDLCNNPLTKEPKLERAVRIVEEWPRLDEEIKQLQEKFTKNRTTSSNKEDFSRKQEL